MGWTYGIKSTRNRFPDLRLSEAAKLADVLGVPRRQFLADLAEALMGPAPKYPGPRLSRAVALPVDQITSINRPPGRPKGSKTKVKS